MKLPAYGRKLWDRRLSGERPRVVALLVGDFWKPPQWLPAEIPRLAVKTDAWHTAAAERFDWRVAAACSVLAIDQRLPGERTEGPDGWDSWLWLLADVQRFARDVLRFTPSEDFTDGAHMFAPERDLEVYAWCGRTFDDGWTWPPWWPHGDAVFERERAAA